MVVGDGKSAIVTSRTWSNVVHTARCGTPCASAAIHRRRPPSFESVSTSASRLVAADFSGSGPCKRDSGLHRLYNDRRLVARVKASATLNVTRRLAVSSKASPCKCRSKRV